MKYLLKNIVITKGTNSRGEYKWMRCDLYNDSDKFANPARLPQHFIFNEEVIADYEPYATPDPTRPGSMVVDTKKMAEDIKKGVLEDMLHITQIHCVVLPLPQLYARVYRTDVKNATGQVEHRAGEFVKSQLGEVIPVDKIAIYGKKYFDPETSEYKWVEEPVVTLRNILSRSYKAYNPEGVVTASTAEADVIEVETEENEQAEIERLKAELARRTAN